jgi:hypothetical protein
MLTIFKVDAKTISKAIEDEVNLHFRHVIKVSKPEETAQRRVMDAVTGKGMVLAIQMRNHEKVALAWKRLR